MKKNTLALCEAGIMIALSTVLAMLKLIDMPYGGSVTFAQMLPILITHTVTEQSTVWARLLLPR